MARFKPAKPTAEEVAAVAEAEKPVKRPSSGIMNGPAGGTIEFLVENLSEEAEMLRANAVRGVLEGRVALELDPHQLIDEVDTDRLDALGGAKDFDSLVQNIKERGQRQPIRVRPADANWKPNAENPTLTTDTFVVQSGRRRLAACRMLGIKVLALVSTNSTTENLTVEDLVERFTENTVRANLTPWEQMLSIGEIASSFPAKTTQAYIAEQIGVNRSAVNQGSKCYKNKADLEALSKDIAEASVEEIRRLISLLEKDAEKTPARIKMSRRANHVTVAREGQRLNLSTGFSLQASQDGQLQVLKDGDKAASKADIIAMMDLIEEALSKAKIKPKK
ncbi:chromosome partitioning protein, ParB family [Sulfitobacter brevis]|uniref:Chromosome partitioning protein, ParB family n=1 Tax=Sulfitobacter brevis TaxID=74348 RepID=A0A1I2GCW0_9RHOB|nr:ParB N-terminal domain-containing protein [Sulfitobacter brevis]SFF14586.1 chromosome partitioning protein, ParB family [Sulfitobacter brevis]